MENQTASTGTLNTNNCPSHIRQAIKLLVGLMPGATEDGRSALKHAALALVRRYDGTVGLW